MSFIKPRTIYKSKTVHVYINECFNPKKKTRLFAIRRDDKTGLGEVLGLIKFSGAWRQYITDFVPDTLWSSSCKRAICDFEDEMNAKWRLSLKR